MFCSHYMVREMCVSAKICFVKTLNSIVKYESRIVKWNLDANKVFFVPNVGFFIPTRKTNSMELIFQIWREYFEVAAWKYPKSGIFDPKFKDFFFFQQTLQLEKQEDADLKLKKFKSVDFKYDNSFWNSSKCTQVIGILVPNSIYFFGFTWSFFSFWQIREWIHQIWQGFSSKSSLKLPKSFLYQILWFCMKRCILTNS